MLRCHFFFTGTGVMELPLLSILRLFPIVTNDKLASVESKFDAGPAVSGACTIVTKTNTNNAIPCVHCAVNICDKSMKCDNNNDECKTTTKCLVEASTPADKKREHRLTSIIDNLKRFRSRQDCNAGIEELSFNCGDTTTETESPSQPQLKTRKRRIPDRMNGSGATDYHLNNNNNNNSTSNNNVKNERLSPGTPDTSSRSRSVTPSSASYPGTPPALDHSQPLPLSGRNYSDFMRSLAAKYNNANPNDYFGAARNGFPPALDPRFKPNPAFTNLIPSHNNKDESPKKADFPNILNPFASNSMFPPLIDMSTTQTLLAMVRSAKEAEIQGLLKSATASTIKRPHGDLSSPLDLSAAGTPMKRPRVKTPSSGKNSDSGSPRPHHQEHDLSTWTVDDVCNFVSSIDICAEYAQKFREQRIDGSGLPLLTEDHLTSTINMKLGPALKLRSILARKIGSCSVCLHCVHCHSPGSDSGTGAGTSGDSGGPS